MAPVRKKLVGEGRSDEVKSHPPEKIKLGDFDLRFKERASGVDSLRHVFSDGKGVDVTFALWREKSKESVGYVALVEKPGLDGKASHVITRFSIRGSVEDPRFEFASLEIDTTVGNLVISSTSVEKGFLSCGIEPSDAVQITKTAELLRIYAFDIAKLFERAREFEGQLTDLVKPNWIEFGDA